jgi:hypothetical protein
MTTMKTSTHRWVDPHAGSGPPLQERSSLVGRHIFWVALLISAVIAGIILFTAEYGGVANGYSTTIEGMFPIGLSRVDVAVEVTNLGTSTATPTCRVELHSPDGFVTGAAAFKASGPILGGSGGYFDMTIPVTNNGANSVTVGSSNVSCQ